MANLSSTLFIAVFGVMLSSVKAMSDDDKSALKAAVAPIFNDCCEETGVSKLQLIDAFIAQKFGSVNPCFFSCFFKGIGAMDPNGIYEAGSMTAKIQKYINNPDKLEAIKGLCETCSYINTEPVSDGDEGCDRALLLVDCMVKNKAGISKYFAL